MKERQRKELWLNIPAIPLKRDRPVKKAIADLNPKHMRN
jgi:hypothetical protein